MTTTRPLPAPPFGSPQFSVSQTSMSVLSFTPTPSVEFSAAISYIPSFSVPQTLGTVGSQYVPHSIPLHGYSDATRMTTGSSHHHIATNKPWKNHMGPPWQQEVGATRGSESQPTRRLQMVNPSSCSGPPGNRPHFGPVNNETQHHKVRMDPVRFDDTEVNNWIRGVQFYFDHVGTPEAQRLHYVIMFFEPVVVDWICNYCSSHEYVMWYEFLDNVRLRFDPQCYTCHIGLLKKLQQTVTVSDYQLAFEKLQNNVMGVPDHVLLELYVVGLKQPLQDEVMLHKPPTLATAFALSFGGHSAVLFLLPKTLGTT